MLFKKETRTISKNGGFIIPVQIRRALGIYSRTQVDIEESKDPDVMMLIKTRPHCICCGKVGNTLVNVDRDSVILRTLALFVLSALNLLALL